MDRWLNLIYSFPPQESQWLHSNQITTLLKSPYFRQQPKNRYELSKEHVHFAEVNIDNYEQLWFRLPPGWTRASQIFQARSLQSSWSFFLHSFGNSYQVSFIGSFSNTFCIQRSACRKVGNLFKYNGENLLRTLLQSHLEHTSYTFQTLYTDLSVSL